MKRSLSLILACVCLLALLVTECNADCGGRQLGKRFQSAMAKVAGVPQKVKQSIQSKRSANCSATAASCSSPAMSSCSAPQTVQVSEAPQPIETVVMVSSPVFESSDCVSGQCTVEESNKSFQPVRNSIAQHKANVQARNGRMQHLGGSFGAGRYEGVGFSTVSADDAIRQCCYWGERTPVDIGVAQGNNGWYATVLYR